MPAPTAVLAVPEPGVPAPGARVVELRLVFEPQAAEAESENDVIARTVSTAKIFFMTSSRICLNRVDWLKSKGSASFGGAPTH